ncbi:hypothetical protein B0T11DRAFT_94615 [Plectosphaerella cucumerina]|uniref:C2H2-type domain-containing protein n=1 Tax=Plectosphaerella cucumerina TaxID=40658 RepID=A0A8K0TK15_9PEZI|nr:hypothetical protein B0T11DRAFT_94615 [Plectosphaerella cucumerina]
MNDPLEQYAGPAVDEPDDDVAAHSFLDFTSSTKGGGESVTAEVFARQVRELDLTLWKDSFVDRGGVLFCRYETSCGHSFSRPCEARKHMKRHMKPFVCNLCGLQVAEKGEMRRHLKSHNAQDKLACGVGNCDAVFTRPYSRTRHQAKVHHIP